MIYKVKRCLSFVASLMCNQTVIENRKKKYVPMDQNAKVKARATEWENYNKWKSVATKAKEKHDQFPYIEDELKCPINKIAPKKN